MPGCLAPTVCMSGSGMTSDLHICAHTTPLAPLGGLCDCPLYRETGRARWWHSQRHLLALFPRQNPNCYGLGSWAEALIAA